ncbi:hypothetical protein V8F20_008327 [Naviculisporaceae sp. PSN 640]
MSEVPSQIDPSQGGEICRICRRSNLHDESTCPSENTYFRRLFIVDEEFKEKLLRFAFKHPDVRKLFDEKFSRIDLGRRMTANPAKAAAIEAYGVKARRFVDKFRAEAVAAAVEKEKAAEREAAAAAAAKREEAAAAAAAKRKEAAAAAARAKAQKDKEIAEYQRLHALEVACTERYKAQAAEKKRLEKEEARVQREAREEDRSKHHGQYKSRKQKKWENRKKRQEEEKKQEEEKRKKEEEEKEAEEKRKKEQEEAHRNNPLADKTGVHSGLETVHERTVVGRPHGGDSFPTVEYVTRWSCCGKIVGENDSTCRLL